MASEDLRRSTGQDIQSDMYSDYQRKKSKLTEALVKGRISRIFVPAVPERTTKTVDC